MQISRRLLIPALALSFTLFPVYSSCLGQKATPAPAAAAASAEPLDINTATHDQLKALPGIGDAYADRIIKGRPYTAKNQLTQRGILPDGVYSKIKSSIVARRPGK